MIILSLYVSLALFQICSAASSPIKPFTSYDHAIELQVDSVDLWWTFNNAKDEITFELHAKTTGWVGLGISPAGGMVGADIAIGWIDSKGKAYVQDRFSFNKTRPIIDNTTQDWFLIQGREQNGWTAIQFKRKLDSCDPMDVPIKSGTTILIFAYGFDDPDLGRANRDIDYHNEQKGSRMIPLLSYADPPKEDSLANLDFIDLRLENNIIPSTDTTYYCKVFKVPRRSNKTHAIGHKVLVDSRNPTLVHHLDFWECSSNDVLDDAKLPDGICDEVFTGYRPCSSTITTSWAVGGDLINLYQKEVGYPISDGLTDKYFMIKIHYDNPKMTQGLRDSSGIRFYLGDELRENDLAYFLFGTLSRPTALSIPPKAKRFMVDSYCPSEVTQNFPATGVNVLSALPHTHLQGISVWTKLIRNNKVVQYLFNAEAFDFNYQFENRLPKPIKIFPGDSFITRCVYSTTNKETVTLGGQRTVDEMCSHTFSYYPIVDFSACLTSIDENEWSTLMNSTGQTGNVSMEQWLHNYSWSSNSVVEWQEFYDKAQRTLIIDRRGQFQRKPMPNITAFEDLPTPTCNRTTDGIKNDSVGLCNYLNFVSTFVIASFTLKMKRLSM